MRYFKVRQVKSWLTGPTAAYLYTMVPLLRTTNLVRLSYLQALLSESGIYFTVFDASISALEAGIGVFPRRLMVEEGSWLAAKRILCNAGEFYDD